ncbi:hypothetical protein RclHR1_06150011 [Rhizophagus clarus]|uniref:Protein kinase domain-containing protein n=1 Tax=Rhizophagus clarus TaxID=94130 RepID=A0A2Z6S340_9GLOM|nr:hypothetical protein RclHR1_06150011 [Rhizophagus clarus]
MASRMKKDTIGKYSLVLEYADGGTLKTYLGEHFNELGWYEKYHWRFNWLHSDNIFIHQKKIKLADFGLSKNIAKASSNTSKIFGVIPFIDPKSLNDQNQSYKLNKKSDVYSIGVLLRQISSGYQPFSSKGTNNNYNAGLILSIINGKREEIIDGTPIEYSDLYTGCWKYEPNKRPNMHDVLILRTIIFPKDIKKENYPLGQCAKSISESSIKIIDLNNELLSNNEFSVNDINNIENKSYLSFQNQKFSSDMMITKNNSSLTRNLLNPLESSFNDIRSNIVDKLITFIIKIHDEGINLNYDIKQLIEQYNQPSYDILNWFLKNQGKPQYIYLLGIFYFYNIDNINENISRAFKLFLQASIFNYSIARVYLGKCYDFGYGVECDKYLAFSWYQESVKNGSIIGQLYLGNCYELGVGIAFKYCKESADNGYLNAQFQLGYYYSYGIGTEVNKEKAFEIYKIAAEKGDNAARNNLGILYEKGEGTERDLEKAFHWFNKAAEEEFGVAQCNLCEYYEFGNFVDKDEIKTFEFYKKSAEHGYISAKFPLGYCYVNGIGTKINKEKGFELYNEAAGKGSNTFDINNNKSINNLDEINYWYHEAAENDNKFALYKLGECYELGKGVCENEIRAFEFYKKSAIQGFVDAQYKLGYCYEKGVGTNTNKIIAFDLYKTAVIGGNVDAQKALNFYMNEMKD